MRLPLDLSNGGWHMPKSLNFRHVNRYSEDRTSLVHLAFTWPLGWILERGSLRMLYAK